MRSPEQPTPGGDGGGGGGAGKKSPTAAASSQLAGTIAGKQRRPFPYCDSTSFVRSEGRADACGQAKQGKFQSGYRDVATQAGEVGRGFANRGPNDAPVGRGAVGAHPRP